MKILGKCLDYFVTGMVFGAISYLCILTFLYSGSTPMKQGLLSVLVISGLIGILSIIFKTSLPIKVAFGIHLLGTFLAFVIMALINHWTIGIFSIAVFFVIYLAIWLVLIGEQKRMITRLNALIKERNQGK